MVSSTDFFIREINHISSKNAYPKFFSSKISNPVSDDHKSRQFFSSTVRNLDNFFPRRSQIATICFLDDFCPREFISSMVHFVDDSVVNSVVNFRVFESGPIFHVWQVSLNTVTVFKSVDEFATTSRQVFLSHLNKVIGWQVGQEEELRFAA